MTWTAADITAVLTAVAALITAVGMAYANIRNNRKQNEVLDEHTVTLDEVHAAVTGVPSTRTKEKTDAKP